MITTTQAKSDGLQILLNTEEHLLQLSKRSVSPDPELIFNPLIDILNVYFDSNETLICKIKLDYFNSSSSRSLLNLCKRLASQRKKGCKISVMWYHEKDDDDSREFGEDLQDLIEMPVELIEVESF
jgi:hypothetical protein